MEMVINIAGLFMYHLLEILKLQLTCIWAKMYFFSMWSDVSLVDLKGDIYKRYVQIFFAFS